MCLTHRTNFVKLHEQSTTHPDLNGEFYINTLMSKKNPFYFLIAPLPVYNDNSCNGAIRNENRFFSLSGCWCKAFHCGAAHNNGKLYNNFLRVKKKFPFLIAPMAVYNDNSASGWIRTKNRGFLLLERWTSAHHHREIASVRAPTVIVVYL